MIRRKQLKTTIVRTVSFVASGLFASSVLADAWTEPLDIKALRTSRLELTQTVIVPETCVNDDKAYLSPELPSTEKSLPLLLAAMMSDKKVRLHCSRIQIISAPLMVKR